MTISQDQFASIQKANIDAAQAFAGVLLGSAERLFSLHAHFGRTLIETQASQGRKLWSVKEPLEVFRLQTDFATPAIEKGFEYARSAYDISAQAQEDIRKLLEERSDEFNKSLSGFLESVSRSAPGGSEAAVAAVRSTISAVNSTIEQFNRTARHVAELTEANVAAASNATVKAVSGSATSKKKAA